MPDPFGSPQERGFLRPEHVHISFSVAENIFTLQYIIENESPEKITVEFPFLIDAYPETLHINLAVSFGVILASLTVPKEIFYDFEICAKKEYQEILAMIYAIRGYSEFLHDIKTPKVSAKKTAHFAKTAEKDTAQKSAVLCWSGGVDSTSAYLLLQKNGYRIHALHTDINQTQAVSERNAIEALSQILHISPTCVSIYFPQLHDIGKKYSTKFAQFPIYNDIPFGRDILHVAISLYLNYLRDAKYICLGYEHETIHMQVQSNKKYIWRHDVQSVQGLHLYNAVAKQVNKHYAVFSPIAGLSKFRVYEMLIKEGLLEYSTSCFFGDACGKCTNCLLYHTISRILTHKKGNIEELRSFLKTHDTVHEETFAVIFYLYFYEVLQKLPKNTDEWRRAEKKFGSVLQKTHSELLDYIHTIHPAPFLPKNFLQK
jgi:7-cyano-7-deazaguanine synthase in queuosine biosynthesis